MTKEEIKSKVYDCLFGKNGKYNDNWYSLSNELFGIRLMGDEHYETIKIYDEEYIVRITNLWAPNNNEIFQQIDVFSVDSLIGTKYLAEFDLRLQKGNRLPDTYEDYLNFRKLFNI